MGDADVFPFYLILHGGFASRVGTASIVLNGIPGCNASIRTGSEGRETIVLSDHDFHGLQNTLLNERVPAVS